MFRAIETVSLALVLMKKFVNVAGGSEGHKSKKQALEKRSWGK